MDEKTGDLVRLESDKQRFNLSGLGPMSVEWDRALSPHKSDGNDLVHTSHVVLDRAPFSRGQARLELARPHLGEIQAKRACRKHRRISEVATGRVH